MFGTPVNLLHSTPTAHQPPTRLENHGTRYKSRAAGALAKPPAVGLVSLCSLVSCGHSECDGDFIIFFGREPRYSVCPKLKLFSCMCMHTCTHGDSGKATGRSLSLPPTAALEQTHLMVPSRRWSSHQLSSTGYEERGNQSCAALPLSSFYLEGDWVVFVESCKSRGRIRRHGVGRIDADDG